MIVIRKPWLPASALALALCDCGVSWSQDKYPSKPIRIVVALGPGAGADTLARFLTGPLGRELQTEIIVENKAGAGGIIGGDYVAKAKPDGYTFLAASSSPMFLAPIVKKIDYKTDDFMHVMVYGKTANCLVVRADAKWKNVKEFVEEEKSSPGKLKVSTYGKQTPGEFVMDLVSKYEGIKFTLIPYKSGADALPPLLGGHVDAAIVAGTVGLLESGQIRLLAIASDKRLPPYPGIPTFEELGYPIIPPAGRYWYCFPKGTPKAIVDKFSAAQEMAVKRYAKEITANLKKIEMWAEFLNREESLIRLKKDADMYLKVVNELGVVGK